MSPPASSLTEADVDLALSEIMADLAGIDLYEKPEDERRTIMWRAMRAAYGKGYVDAVTDGAWTVAAAQEFTRQAMVKLPVS